MSIYRHIFVQGRLAGRHIAGSLIALAALTVGARGAESVCAKVRIEINQEVTLERQAFEARMTIANDLPGATVSEISVALQFRDEAGTTVAFSTPDSNPSGALFFVKPQGTHQTVIASGTSSTLTWLIIPSPGAGGGGTGELYFAGATLTYSALERTEVVEVNPDYFFVKPQPRLKLDYFLPAEVFGDDLLTSAVEPVEPFTLGLRILNSGSGPVHALTVTSGQPRIVSNESELAITFSINSAFVNDRPAPALAQLSIGDLNAGAAGTAGWKMVASLYGRIAGFNASYTHSDDLGGQTTSLFEEIEEHVLAGMVLVDLPDRDVVRDFLATTGTAGSVSVYESNGIISSVPAGANFVGLQMAVSGTRWALSVPSGASSQIPLLRLQADLPNGAPVSIRRAVRSDGKVLPTSNAWVSKTRTLEGGQPVYHRFVNIFDTNASSSLNYEVEFGASQESNNPPIIGPLRNMFAHAGSAISFAVTASDPDGPAPILTAPLLPAGATFSGGLFHWIPSAQQEGNYVLTFRASDGIAETSKSMLLTVVGENEEFLDAWKERWFPGGTADETANWADPDGDGLSNLLEYALDLDPTASSIDRKPVIGRMQDGGQNYLTLTYVHRTDDASLLIQTVGSSEVRQDEGLWAVQSTEVGDVSQSDLPPGMVRKTVRDSEALEDEGFRFLRLKVSVVP